MRFLIVTISNSPMPPDMGPMLVNAMKEWLATYRANGKIEQTWSFAGITGGGGILNVESHEELDEIMTSFPFGPFSKIEVYPLSDLDRSLDAASQVMQRFAGA